MTPLHLSVLDRSQLLFGVNLTESIEAGQQRDGEPGPYHLLPASGDGPERLVIASSQEKENVSRQHLLLEPRPTGQVRILNRSQIPLAVADHSPIPPGGAVELLQPFTAAWSSWLRGS